MNNIILILQYTAFAGAIFIQWSNNLSGGQSFIIKHSISLLKQRKKILFSDGFVWIPDAKLRDTEGRLYLLKIIHV